MDLVWNAHPIGSTPAPVAARFAGSIDPGQSDRNVSGTGYHVHLHDHGALTGRTRSTPCDRLGGHVL